MKHTCAKCGRECKTITHQINKHSTPFTVSACCLSGFLEDDRDDVQPNIKFFKEKK